MATLPRTHRACLCFLTLADKHEWFASSSADFGPVKHVEFRQAAIAFATLHGRNMQDTQCCFSQAQLLPDHRPKWMGWLPALLQLQAPTVLSLVFMCRLRMPRKLCACNMVLLLTYTCCTSACRTRSRAGIAGCATNGPSHSFCSGVRGQELPSHQGVHLHQPGRRLQLCHHGLL